MILFFTRKTVGLYRGWVNKRGMSFFVPLKVTRLTKTLFICGEYKFHKEDGRGYQSNNGNAYLLGEDANIYWRHRKSEIVKDQSKEYKLFSDLMGKYWKAKECVERIDLTEIKGDILPIIHKVIEVSEMLEGVNKQC